MKRESNLSMHAVVEGRRGSERREIAVEELDQSFDQLKDSRDDKQRTGEPAL